MLQAEEVRSKVLNLPAVLKANFAQWSKGKDKLTLDDVNRLSADPSKQSAEAAAISVLKDCVFGSGKGKVGRNANLFVADPKTWDPAQDGITVENITYFLKSFLPDSPLRNDANALNKAFLERAEPKKPPKMPPAFSLSLSSDKPLIYCLAFSPDGKTVAIGGSHFPWAGEVALWDLATGQRLWSAEEHPQAAWCLAFSRDGKYLASGGGAGAVKVWSASRGRLLADFTRGIGTVKSVHFTPDGKGLVAGDEERVNVWDIATTKAQATFRFTNREDRFLTYEAELVDENRLRDVPLTVEFTNRIYTVFATALSPDGKVIAVGGGGKEVICWERETGKVLPRLVTDHPNGVGRLGFSPDGKTLATTGLMGRTEDVKDDTTVRVWDVASGRKVASAIGNEVCFSRDGKMLLTYDRPAGCLRLHDLGTGKDRLAVKVPDDQSWGRTVAISPDGKMVAAVIDGAEVRFWDAVTGKQVSPGRR